MGTSCMLPSLAQHSSPPSVALVCIAFRSGSQHPPLRCLHASCTPWLTDNWERLTIDRPTADRQTDRQADRQADRQTDRYRQTEARKQAHRQIDHRQTDRSRQTGKHIDRPPDRPTTNTHIDTQTHRYKDRRRHLQTDRQTHTGRQLTGRLCLQLVVNKQIDQRVGSSNNWD